MKTSLPRDSFLPTDDVIRSGGDIVDTGFKMLSAPDRVSWVTLATPPWRPVPPALVANLFGLSFTAMVVPTWDARRSALE